MLRLSARPETQRGLSSGSAGVGGGVAGGFSLPDLLGLSLAPDFGAGVSEGDSDGVSSVLEAALTALLRTARGGATLVLVALT